MLRTWATILLKVALEVYNVLKFDKDWTSNLAWTSTLAF